MFKVQAKKREGGEKLEAIRKAGDIPAVFYGAGKPTTHIALSKVEFKKVWRDAGESSAVKIEMPEGAVDVLIHEVQVDPITNEPIHADFLAIDMKKKIHVKVPLVFDGTPGAVKSGIGNLVKVLHEIEVEALPADLPHDITVDVTGLNTLEDSILVSAIKAPAGVTFITPEAEVVASIVAQVEEKEEEAAPVDLSAIEVEKKGKKEEEGGAEEAEKTA